MRITAAVVEERNGPFVLQELELADVGVDEVPVEVAASLDINHVMTGGRVVRGIVEGETVPQEFLPHLVVLWRRGEFPVDRFMTYYDFDEIDHAAHDAESGPVVKPVLRMH